MSYSKKVQKAKANRSDHRKARAVAGSVNRTALKRDSKKFKSLEREHDQNQRFGGSLKAVYFDSDGDGYKDTYGRVYRSGVVGKPGAEIPTFGPSNPPVSGPTGLLVSKLADKPASGPSDLIARILAPANGPTGLDSSIIAPASGPSGLDASISIPNAGPSGLGAVVNAPNSGPTTLDASVNAPANGPTGLIASEGIPDGPTGLDATVNAPNSGPTGLDATVNAPNSGPTDLSAGTAAPANGPTGLDATVNAPANGPTGLSAAKATLNITIEASQATVVAKTPDAGTIEYASDVGYLFIYDGTDWHHINGA
jgi:hypothetical protein